MSVMRMLFWANVAFAVLNVLLFVFTGGALLLLFGAVNAGVAYAIRNEP